MSENTEKYFSQFGGLKVKDEEARKDVTILKEQVTNKSTLKELNKNQDVSFWVGSKEELENTDELPGNNVLCFTDDDILAKIEQVIETEVAKRVEENSVALELKIAELEEKNLTLENTLQTHKHYKNIFVGDSEMITGKTFTEKQLQHFYEYNVNVSIEATDYSNADNMNVVNMSLIFDTNHMDVAGWSGQGVMCVCIDKENDLYETYKVVVDVSGTLSKNENNDYVLRLGTPDVDIRNNDNGITGHINKITIV